MLSKIVERIMYNRLVEYLNRYKILCKKQISNSASNIGIQHICFDTLMDKTSKAIDKGYYTLGISVDLSKAFDTINQEIFLVKLDFNGTRNIAVDWLNSDLSDRMQQFK